MKRTMNATRPTNVPVVGLVSPYMYPTGDPSTIPIGAPLTLQTTVGNLDDECCKATQHLWECALLSSSEKAKTGGDSQIDFRAICAGGRGVCIAKKGKLDAVANFSVAHVVPFQKKFTDVLRD